MKRGRLPGWAQPRCCGLAEPPVLGGHERARRCWRYRLHAWNEEGRGASAVSVGVGS
jgi:hypothetical protein